MEGRAGGHFDYDSAAERSAVVGMLARLHRATSVVESIARRIDLGLPGRNHLESALLELDRTWTGGPFSEPARQALASRALEVAEMLGIFDRLSREVAGLGSPWVVTHGEPHSVNVMRTVAGNMLVDWDTVALAPPERDLWMFIGDTDDAPAYVEATGHRPERVAIDFFRLMWDFADLAAYVAVLRAPHRQSEDTLTAYEGLTRCVRIRDRWPALSA